MILITTALVAPLSPAQRRESTVTLHNGGIFRGLVLTETHSYLDLELDKGRIRLYRPWIACIERPEPHPDAATPLPAAVFPGTPPAGGAPVFPVILEEAAARVVPLLGALNDLKFRQSAETLAMHFLEALADGRGSEFIERHLDVQAVMSRAFPRSFRSLTAYSRRIAIRNFTRLILSAIDPSSMRRMLDSGRVSARLLSRDGDLETVEIRIQQPDRKEIFGLVGIRAGRIADLSMGPSPFQEILQGLSAVLSMDSGGGMGLLEAIETAVLADAMRPRQPRPDSGAAAEEASWVLAREGNPLILRFGFPWHHAPKEESPPALDFLVFHEECLVACAGISERGAVGLSDAVEIYLSEARRRQLIESEAAVERTEETRDGIPCVRLRFTAATLPQPMAYDILLCTAEGFLHQIAVFCPAGERESLEDRIEAIFAEVSIRPAP